MVFPKSFFKAETRENFEISEMMKRAWSAEIEVLELIKKICREHQLKYYAMYGTLLGAVRHRGFIPWDDDLDICMLRDDFESFLHFAESELPEGFVISGIYGKEPRLWKANQEPQGRVIADETFFTLPRYMNYFHGFPYMRIGIDIFPIDYIPEEKEEQYILAKLCNDVHFMILQWDRHKREGTLEGLIASAEQRLGIKKIPRDDEDRLQRELRFAADRAAASVDRSKTEHIANILYCIPPETEAAFSGISKMSPEWFGEGIELPFECTEITVPVNYLGVLKASYGEGFNTPRPFTSWHEYPFYKTQEKAFSELLRESGVNTPVDEFCRKWHLMNGGT